MEGHIKGNNRNRKTKNKKLMKNGIKKYGKKDEKENQFAKKNINKKEKRKSKPKKFKVNQKGLSPDSHMIPQTYTCDFYGLTKAQSVSRTQLNRAQRVKSKMKQLQEYSSSAATIFTRSFENMQSATKNGKTCKGQNLTTEGLQIYNTLKNCSVSVPVACNIANIDIDPGFQTFQQENETITKCIPLLDKYGTDYKVSSDKCRKQIIFLYIFLRSEELV